MWPWPDPVNMAEAAEWVSSSVGNPLNLERGPRSSSGSGSLGVGESCPPRRRDMSFSPMASWPPSITLLWQGSLLAKRCMTSSKEPVILKWILKNFLNKDGVERRRKIGMRQVKSHDSSQMTHWGNFRKESQSHESSTDDSSH